MSAWAKPGVKVVCIDATWYAGHFPAKIKEGFVYVIDSVREMDGGDWSEVDLSGAVGLLLQGVWNDDHDEGVFASTRFKPLITKTQDQDVFMFKSLLNKAPINETA